MKMIDIFDPTTKNTSFPNPETWQKVIGINAGSSPSLFALVDRPTSLTLRRHYSMGRVWISGLINTGVGILALNSIRKFLSEE